jgi:transposase
LNVDLKLLQGNPDCPHCAALELRILDLQQSNEELRQRVADLEDRLRSNSSNSSKAPSSDPYDRPNLKPRNRSGKKPGGQPGHKGYHRQLLPPEEVDRIVRHLPKICVHCQKPLREDQARLQGRHQVAELPPRAVIVTEHQSYACRCEHCGGRSVEAIPPSIASRCTGPRLSAALCYLSAYMHGSRRAVEEVAKEVLGCELSLGTVSFREKEMTQALEEPYTQVQQQVRAAPAKNVDETGWKRAGKWLWVAATPNAALFHIDRVRSWHGLQNLLGQWVQGVVCSDRYGVYDHLKLGRRAICWAHLKRDFQKWVDRGGSTVHLGKRGLAITRKVCRLYGRYKGGGMDRAALRRAVIGLRHHMRKLLAWGMNCGVKKAADFCRRLKRHQRAMWTFARVEGIEPTNNHAERMLRPGVIWRKKSFGSHSEGGCRYAERMLTIIHTLRLHHRSAMAYLADALTAYRQGSAIPALV